MEINDRIIKLCKNKNLRKASVPKDGCVGRIVHHGLQQVWIPSLDQLFDMLFESEEGWRGEDLWGFLEVLEDYAHVHNIKDFYELVLRFTLSEVFGEETHGRNS